MRRPSAFLFVALPIEARPPSKYHSKKGPEARLFSACLAAILLPAGMFIYAWTTFPSVPWIGMVMGVFVSSYRRSPLAGSGELIRP